MENSRIYMLDIRQIYTISTVIVQNNDTNQVYDMIKFCQLARSYTSLRRRLSHGFVSMFYSLKAAFKIKSFVKCMTLLVLIDQCVRTFYVNVVY
jgi:hypothetical protein